MDPADFFDRNSNYYGSLKPYKYDYFFRDTIERNRKGCKLLDIGGGEAVLQNYVGIISKMPAFA